MKRKTCKLLLWIGIIWLVIIIAFASYYVYSTYQLNKGALSSIVKDNLFFVLLAGIPSYFLFLLAWAGWNLEKKQSLTSK